jgi:4-aminobutyrate aminotransferase/(S)-3-amino-2-methylpropionate transaminase
MAEELARLASLGDATSQLKKTYLCNSGSEAIDGLIRISKTFKKRSGIIAFSGAFHGLNAVGGMSVLGSKSSFKVGSRPLLPEVSFMPYAYCYRCPFGLNYPECDIACANYFEYMLDYATHPQDIALVLMEPLQGEGGYITPPKEFVQKIKQLCEKHQILFGADEVQTGFAKTGKMFAVEHFDVKPDIVALAKPLGGGLPLGAVLGRDDLMSVAMALSGTFGGNPVSCAAGLATLNIIQREKLADRATRLGEKVMKRLLDMKEEHKFIGDVRGKGLLIGIEIVKDKETKAMGAEECFEIRRRMWEKGVITLAGGLNYHVVRLAPALNIPEEVLDDGVNVFEEALTEFEREFPAGITPKA